MSEEATDAEIYNHIRNLILEDDDDINNFLNFVDSNLYEAPFLKQLDTTMLFERQYNVLIQVPQACERVVLTSGAWNYKAYAK